MSDKLQYETIDDIKKTILSIKKDFGFSEASTSKCTENKSNFSSETPYEERLNALNKSNFSSETPYEERLNAFLERTDDLAGLVIKYISDNNITFITNNSINIRSFNQIYCFVCYLLKELSNKYTNNHYDYTLNKVHISLARHITCKIKLPVISEKMAEDLAQKKKSLGIKNEEIYIPFCALLIQYVIDNIFHYFPNQQNIIKYWMTLLDAF